VLHFNMMHLQVGTDRARPPAACWDAFHHGSLVVGKVLMVSFPAELTDQSDNHVCTRIWSGVHIGTKRVAAARGA